MSDYDSPWKEFLDNYLEAFLQFSFPDLHKKIDWSHEVVMRDTELQQIAPESELGLRVVDKLAEVMMLDGAIKWLLIHVEVQSQKTELFPKRMFTYFYRIQDKYDKPLVSVAILGDDDPNWHPTSYSQDVYGCKIQFNFLSVKLLDYLNDLKALERSQNPFAIIAYAHLVTLQTANQPDSRRLWKIQLMRLLYRKGYAAEEIRRLFRVIDWMMDLPSELEIQFRTDIETIEQETAMDNVVTIESLARDKGREEGIESGVVAGQILAFQSVLGEKESRLEELLKTPLEELVNTLAQLNLRIKSISKGDSNGS